MQHLPSPVGYREDINGLRAWAVIAVLLYHFKIPGINAGFIGVDVFFVISGFLMTSIIIKGLERDNFSIWKFYMARVRRIVPALMVLIAILLILGWFWLPTPDYKALGSQSAYSLSFLSNIHFWHLAGYFDTVAQEKWLLHTWSLGVEAQFYLLFPLFLIILWKVKPHIKALFWGLGFVFIASLLLSTFASSWRPAAAFYLLPTRGWELAAGGLAFLIGREFLAVQRFAKPMFWVGVILLLVGVFLLDSQYAWPSGWALFPVLGTVLIILANRPNSKIMVNPVVQWLGERSYSLYLWHWPLVVALYFVGLQNDWFWVACALFASLVLAHLSYQLVEVPTRSYLTASSLRKEVIAIAVTGVVIGLAAVFVNVFSFEGRFPLQVKLEAAEAEATNKDPRIQQCFSSASDKGSVGCVYGKEKIGAILMGDSHSASMITAIEKVALNNNLGTLFWGMTSCPTLDNIKYSSRSKLPTNLCSDFNQWAYQQLKNHKNTPLVLVSRTSTYLMGPNEPEAQVEAKYAFIHFSKPYVYRSEEGYAEEFQSVLTSTACRLAKDRPVYLMRPIPEFGINISVALSRNFLLGRNAEDIKITLEKYHQRNKLVWEAQDKAAVQCGVKILNPLPYLCDDKYCYGSKNGRPLYYDDDHLSEYGNKFLVPIFEQVFRDQQVQE